MIERNKHCTLCELSANCTNPCLTGKGSSIAKLMVVAECPSLHDDKNLEVLGAKKDEILRYVLKEAMGVNPEEVYITFLVKCAPVYGERANEVQVHTCVETYLDAEIEAVKPTAILTLGELGLKELTGASGITKNRGEIFYYKDIPVIPTYGTGYAMQTQNLTEQFAKDVDKAWLISEGAKVTGKQVPWKLITNAAEMEEACTYVEEAGEICFDFETTGLNMYYSDEFKPTLLCFSFQLGFAYAFPLFHFENTMPEEEIRVIFDIYNQRVLQNSKIEKVNHNIKYELHVLRFFGINDIAGRLQDTMLQHHILDEDKKHGLKEIVDYTFPEYSGYSNEIKKYKWEKIPLKLLINYGVTDTDRTLALCWQQEQELLKDFVLYRLYRNLTMPALRALYQAEANGIKINVPYLEQSIIEVKELIELQDAKLRNNKTVIRYGAARKQRLLQKAIDEQEYKIQQAKIEGKARVVNNADKKLEALRAGTVSVCDEINFASVPQLKEILYTEEGFNYPWPYSKTHKTQKDVTGKSALLTLSDKSGFINNLLIMRSISKMLSTYMEGIHKLLDKKHRIHSSFLLQGTETGRLSSREPNLQNIPRAGKLNDEISKEVVGRIKKLYIPDRNCYFVQVDYSQAELRIAAEFADEHAMLEVYNNDGDLHIATAMRINKLTIKQWEALDPKIAKEHRSRAKAGNFGLIYGISPRSFVEYAKDNYGVDLTLDESETIHNDYFRIYKNLKVWHAGSIQIARSKGYVRTLYGRKRRTPEIMHADGYIRSMDERVAINSPVQGTAGEFTIFALALLSQRLPDKIKLVNTVHDSILYCVPKEMLIEACRIIKQTCENLPNVKFFGRDLKKVKMKVDLEYSDKSWGDLKPIDFEI